MRMAQFQNRVGGMFAVREMRTVRSGIILRGAGKGNMDSSVTRKSLILWGWGEGVMYLDRYHPTQRGITRAHTGTSHLRDYQNDSSLANPNP